MIKDEQRRGDEALFLLPFSTGPSLLGKALLLSFPGFRSLSLQSPRFWFIDSPVQVNKK